jgi:hypothetical protein
MQIPEELSHDIRRQVMEFTQKRKTELTAALDALKETEKAIKATTTSTGSKTGRASRAEVKDRILEMLKEGNSGVINDIVKSLGSSYGTTYRAVLDLIEEGKIVKGDDNRIRLSSMVAKIEEL